MSVKEPRITVIASEELLLVLMQAASALKASRKKDAVRTPAVLNELIVRVSTARGTWEHAQRQLAIKALEDLKTAVISDGNAPG